MNVVLLLNDRPESRSALDWALANIPRLAIGEAPCLQIVIAGAGDSPASPNYASPALSSHTREVLDHSEMKYHLHDTEPDLADQVISLAEETAAALIVLGVRRRSATMKLLVGSHTQRILLDAPCPVVAVKEPTTTPAQ